MSQEKCPKCGKKRVIRPNGDQWADATVWRCGACKAHKIVADLMDDDCNEILLLRKVLTMARRAVPCIERGPKVRGDVRYDLELALAELDKEPIP